MFCKVEDCASSVLARGYCSKHYQRLIKGIDPHEKSGSDLTEEERFWSYVDVGSADECWLWTGSTRGIEPLLYGMFWSEGRHEGAHRYAYKNRVKPIGDLHVLHKCDTPLCVNPDHLFLGTHADNMADKRKKNRGVESKTHCVNGHERNAKNSYRSKAGLKACRVCHRLRERERRAKLKLALQGE